VFFRDRQAVVGLVIIAIAGGAALAAPLVSPWDPLASAGVERLSPIGTAGHLLGTDEQGRDILSRLIWGGRASLLVGILPTVAAAIVALGLGLLAGYAGWRYRPSDHARARRVLRLSRSCLLGHRDRGRHRARHAEPDVRAGRRAGAVQHAVVRTATLSVKPLEYVEAARALGASRGRLIGRHLLPNVLPPLLGLHEHAGRHDDRGLGGLSFLGLGVQPPTPDWGVMVGNGRLVLYRAAHVATIPGIVIVVAALAFNFVGDGLREALDPRARR
jgi:peptide/nickel transport system permease protein